MKVGARCLGVNKEGSTQVLGGIWQSYIWAESSEWWGGICYTKRWRKEGHYKEWEWCVQRKQRERTRHTQECKYLCVPEAQQEREGVDRNGLRKRVGVMWQRGCAPGKGMDIYLQGNRVTFHDLEPLKNGPFSYFKSIPVFMWGRIGECSYWKRVYFFNKIILFGLDMNCTILSHVGKYLRRLVCCCLVTKSCLTLLRLPGLAHQAPLSMGFLRQEYWSGLPNFLLQVIFSTQGLNPCLLPCR